MFFKTDTISKRKAWGTWKRWALRKQLDMNYDVPVFFYLMYMKQKENKFSLYLSYFFFRFCFFILFLTE